MKIYEVKSFAKINLALHVTGKLANLHKIESVVNFIDLHDKIFIKKIDSNTNQQLTSQYLIFPLDQNA